MFDSGSYDRRVMFGSMTGGITREFFSKSSESLEKEVKSYSASKTKELREIIYEKVTRKSHKHKSPEKKDGTLKKCISLFKEKVNPNVLIELEKSLSKRIELEKSLKKKEEYQKHYKYYIENFLPALKAEVIKSEELAKLLVFNSKGEQSQRSQTIRGKIIEMILGMTNKISNNDHSSSTIQNQNSHRSGQIDNTNTPKLSSDSDSEMNLPITSEESLSLLGSGSLTSVTNNSSEKSVNLTLNPVEEKKDPQTENKKEAILKHLTKARPKGPIGRRSPSKYQKSSQYVISATGSHVRDPMQSEKKEAANYENNSKVKQPHNKNLHVALVAGCALLAIGCIVAGAMTSGLVGAGLFAIAALFATVAAAELRLSFISSKLTSINVSSLIDNKKLTR